MDQRSQRRVRKKILGNWGGKGVEEKYYLEGKKFVADISNGKGKSILKTLFLLVTSAKKLLIRRETERGVTKGNVSRKTLLNFTQSSSFNNSSTDEFHTDIKVLNIHI